MKVLSKSAMAKILNLSDPPLDAITAVTFKERIIAYVLTEAEATRRGITVFSDIVSPVPQKPPEDVVHPDEIGAPAYDSRLDPEHDDYDPSYEPPGPDEYPEYPDRPEDDFRL